MSDHVDWDQIPEQAGEPDFDNLLAVLKREVPKRPTLFEFILNDRLYDRLVESEPQGYDENVTRGIRVVRAFARAGYDYALGSVPGFRFHAEDAAQNGIRTRSLNEGGVIGGWESFRAYEWPDPEMADYGILDRLAPMVPQSMKLLCCGPYGVLENAIRLVGYEPLCYMLTDDEKLASAIFEEIGTRLVRYYELCVRSPTIGACIAADDWGFKTQTLLSPAQMRRYVFPWHKRIVQTAHGAGLPAILHSCGNLESVFEDIVEDMGYDARHSFEDTIQPVEEAYEAYHHRIAILGGIDVDFVCRSTPEQVYERSKAMLERTASRGGYALGTGNSVPPYVPDENYLAMTRAVLETR